jgi:hypothetical protein
MKFRDGTWGIWECDERYKTEQELLDSAAESDRELYRKEVDLINHLQRVGAELNAADHVLRRDTMVALNSGDGLTVPDAEVAVPVAEVAGHPWTALIMRDDQSWIVFGLNSFADLQEYLEATAAYGKTVQIRISPVPRATFKAAA